MLLADHERMDRMLAELFEAAQAYEVHPPPSSRRFTMDGPDPVAEEAQSVLRQKWVMLEESLMNHMAAEEALLFPVLRQVDMAEALALQGEHQAIRHTFMEIGAGIGLARSPLTHHFAQLLSKHAQRESALLYAWASAQAPQNITDALRMRLKRTFVDL